MSEFKQTDLFKSSRQRGTSRPAAPEYLIHCMIADDLKRFIAPGWIYTHIPAGEHRHKNTAARLKRMGVIPGWPDFILFNQRGEPHFLELKRETGSRLSVAQENFQIWALDAGVHYALHKGYNAAREQLEVWGCLRGLARSPMIRQG